MTCTAIGPDTILGPDDLLCTDGYVCDYLNIPSGGGATTPHKAGLAAGSGTVDLRAELWPVAWAVGGGNSQAIISQDTGGGAGSRFWFGLDAAGNLKYNFYNTSGTFSTLSTVAVTGAQKWVRVLHSISTGTVDFYTSPDGSTWSSLGTQITGLSTMSMATTGTPPVVHIGDDAYGSGHLYVGAVFNTRVIIGGSTILNIAWAVATDGTGPWTATSGETWTRVGTAYVKRCVGAAVFSVSAAATQAQVATATPSRTVSHISPATQAQVAAVSLVKNAAPSGLPQIVKVPAPASPTDVLGCGDARAEIRDRGGARIALDLPNITAVEWNRVRSDTSLGSVTLDGVAIGADPACCAVLNTIRPWKHELYIYRDDELAWCGPITEMTLDGPVMQIKARDISAWLDRRFIHFTHQWGGTQANQGSEESTTIFLAITADAILPERSFVPTAPQFFDIVGVNGAAPLDLMQRTYTPAQFKPCGPEMRDIAKGPLDWTVVNRDGYLNHSTWAKVVPNPVANPTFEVDVAGWSGMTRDTAVFHSGVASGRTAATPFVTGSIDGLVVGRNYQLRAWMRGTSSALDAGQVPNYDGVIRVGKSSPPTAGENSESSVFSWYVYGQPTGPNHDNRGRTVWIQIGVFFTAAASHELITITATGNPQDSHGIYFDDFEVWEQIPSFTLRDYSLAEPAKVALSGLDQVNRAIVANQQSGGDYAFYKEAPSPNWALGSTTPPNSVFSDDQTEFGLLEGISTQPLTDATGAANAAQAKAASLGGTPILLDNIVLAPSAGVLMSQLIPGVLFQLRLDEPCFAVQANLVLQSVDVKTTPSGGETVKLGFEPTGF